MVLVKRLLRDHVAPHKGRVALAMLFMAVAAAMAAVNAKLLEPAIDLVLVKQDRTMLWLIPVVVLVVAFVNAVATYGQSVMMNNLGQRIIGDLQVRLFSRLMRADLAFFQQRHTGTITSNFLYDTENLRDAISRALTGIAKDSLMAVFLLAVMFSQDWQLALGTMIVLPLVGVFIRKVGRRMRKASSAAQEETGKLGALLTETLEGVRVIKAYGRENHEIERARATVESRLAHLFRAARIRSAASPMTEFLGGMAMAIAFFYGGWKSGLGELSVGQFGSFIAALLLSYRPLKSLANMNADLQKGLAAAQRLFAMMDVEPEIVEHPQARELALSHGAITFDNVVFSYGGGEIPALDGISLEVAAGQTVALVGPSGAGKSTVLNLIPRFYDVNSGRVTIDGTDIRDVTLASLRGSIALVTQETVLFDDTVRNNIAYGRPEASEADIVAAAEAAAAHDFIAALPQGYDTVVGEGGGRLSGGQRQRIAIARAMLRDAPILLLDEATSALDSAVEQQVKAALAKLMAGRTTLVIAHRLSTIAAADRIYVLDGGKVIESGTHADLLAHDGTYAHLYALQFAHDDRPGPRPGPGTPVAQAGV